MIIPVILAGGLGKRLWPLSREQHPKQLLPLYNEKSLLQNTLLRVKKFTNYAEPIIIGNYQRRFILKLQLKEIGFNNIHLILEPEGRGSATAIALAALYAQEHYDDPILLILPIDHYIKDVSSMQDSIEAAEEAAHFNKIVVFGTPPVAPDTNYGYIKVGNFFNETSSLHVERFIEKPELNLVKAMLNEGGYYWNSGMFMFKTDIILENLKGFASEVLCAADEALQLAEITNDYINVNRQAFLNSPNIAIDYAVMEKTHDAVMVKLNTEFYDIGNWKALHNISYKNEMGNTEIGDIISIDTKDCYLRSDHRLIAVLGLQDQIVIETADVVFIAPKEQVKNVGKLVDALNIRSREEAVKPQILHRAWGYYKMIDRSEKFQIKELSINPSQKIIFDKPLNHSESWLILSGHALFYIDDESTTLTDGQAISIQAGKTRKLENMGPTKLEIIQIVIEGSNLGFDKQLNEKVL